MIKKARYLLLIKSADATTLTDAFMKAQRKITGKVRKDIKKKLAKKDLAAEFNYETARNSQHSRAIIIHASEKAADVIRKVPNVKDVTRLAGEWLV